MAGSATISGKQHYILGIGHPKTDALTEGAPIVFSEDGNSLVGPDGLIDYIDGVSLNCVADGVTDVTDEFKAAAALANAKGVAVILPPGTIVISSTVAVDKIIGFPGKSKIILSPVFTKTGFANQFCIINSTFSNSFNESTAGSVFHYGYDIETTPENTRSIIGLGNVKGGLIELVNIKANQYLNGGVPIAVDSLVDLYACVKNVTIRNCVFSQLTGAYGATKVAAGGGGCIWVRNLRSTSGDASLNVTENNQIYGNTFYHLTSDEVLAIYGVRGPTRYNDVYKNHFFGLDSVGAYHAVFLSIFPLDDGSGAGLGSTAAVYGNTIRDNYVSDRSFLYNVLKIGNTPDASRECYDNKFSNNVVNAFRSSNPTTGPRAIWVAAGSPSTDPDVGSKAILCINGTLGTAYAGAVSGNSSDSDSVTAPSGGSQVNAAFAGWHNVSNPIARGNFFTGVENSRVVSGGEFDVFGRAFYNCNQVSGAFARVNGSASSSYCVNVIDSSSAQSYLMGNVRFTSSSGFVSIGASVPATSTVLLVGNCGSVANSGIAAIANNANPSCVVKAHVNSLTGLISGPVSGTGTTTRTDNYWAGTVD